MVVRFEEVLWGRLSGVLGLETQGDEKFLLGVGTHGWGENSNGIELSNLHFSLDVSFQKES